MWSDLVLYCYWWCTRAVVSLATMATFMCLYSQCSYVYLIYVCAESILSEY